MMRQILTALMLIFLCLQIAACGPAGTEKPALAFVASDRDKNEQIYLVNANGSGLRRLVEDEGRSWSPAWSPDGHKIAYAHDKDGNWDIYVMDVSKGDVSRLTSDPGMDDTPAWSPDGSKIAFMSSRNGTFQLYSMDADGTNQQRLIDSKEHAGLPSWSPDGRKIAFIKALSKGEAVCILYVDSGSQSCPLTEVYNVYHVLAWSRDGTKLAFSKGDGVYVSDVEDGSTKRLAWTAWNPAWSPTGEQIAYINSPDTAGDVVEGHPLNDLFVMNSDGTNQKAVGHLNSNWLVWDGPAWSPDGSKIAFVVHEGIDKRAIYVIGSDGSNLKRITDRWYSVERPVWAPR
jgi:Tol biopolymer transport system component